MHKAPRPRNEAARLEKLRDLGVLDTPPDQVFDDLVELARQERRLTDLIDAASDAIICADDAGVLTLWNHAAERMFGYAAEEALGRPLSLIVPQRMRAAHDAGFARFRATGEKQLSGPVELPGLRKDGSEFTLELTIAAWKEPGGTQLAGIIRDVTARKAAETALIAAKLQAEAANAAKSAFLANMSHEIRTPLNGIVGVVDLLAAEPLSERQTELAQVIRGSSRQLQHVLGDVLDLARIEAGELSLSEEPFHLGEAIEAARDLCALRAVEKGVALITEIAPEAHCAVLGDEVRLKQVVINLLANAIKFTAEGRVRLSVVVAGDRFRLSVADTGIGFDADQKARLFERFHQADGAITRRFGGTGLGLAICREIVEAMGGTIGAEAEPGRGATFTVDLPLRLAAQDAPAAGVAARTAPALGAQPLRVLVADDHPTNRRVIELILESVAAEVLAVEDGAQALEAFRAAPFDVVLMDMLMPVMDGLTATREIRRLEREAGCPPTPVIMLTANALASHVEAAITAGADLHLSKPVTAEALLQGLAEALRGQDGAEKSPGGAISAA